MKADIYDVIFFLMKISKCFSPSILPGANVIKNYRGNLPPFHGNTAIPC